MALPKDITFVTFDVYGTLIDWEAGIAEAFIKEAAREGFTINRDQLIPIFMSVKNEVESGSYELYAEVLRRIAIKVAEELEWPLESSRSGFLPDSLVRWKPFKETMPQLNKLKKRGITTGLISNIDDKLLGESRRHLKHDFDLVVTAQQVRSYKPDPSHFKECERRVGGKKGWVHIGSSYDHDIEPCLKGKVPVIWVNRHKQQLEPGQKKPTAEAKNLLEAMKIIGMA